jgi:hypothetical protein
MTTTLTSADIARRNHRRAVKFFWTWLIMATWVSLAGNVTHAWLTATPSTQWLAAAVAAVPPIVLLLSVHGLAVLAKATASGAVYRASVAATAALAVGAFTLSFVALRDLAIIAGIRPPLAPVLPLVIDLAIGVATLALVAIGDKPTRRSRSATGGAAAAATIGATLSRAAATPTGGPDASQSRESTSGPELLSANPVCDAATVELAAALIAEKVTRQPVEVVARILTAHAQGDPLNRIAKDLGVHHSAVSRVIEAVARRIERSLVTV